MLVVLAAALVTGCAGLEPQPEGERAPGVPARVRVINLRLEDVTVFLGRGDARVTLGSVAARDSATLGVSKEMVGPGLVLLAEPVRGPTIVTSEEFALGRGQVAVWTVRDPPADSTLVLH